MPCCKDYKTEHAGNWIINCIANEMERSFLCYRMNNVVITVLLSECKLILRNTEVGKYLSLRKVLTGIYPVGSACIQCIWGLI